MSLLTRRTWISAAPALVAVAVSGVCLSPAHGELTHQYLFNSGDGFTAVDSVGGANGTAIASDSVSPIVNVSESRLVLDGGSAFAELPASTIAINTYSEVTLEMWMAQTGNNDQFTFAAGFGRTSDGSNGETSGLGYDYLMMQPTRAGGDGSRGAISFGTFDGEVGVTDGSRDLNDGGLHHVVMTVNATDLAYYVDGMQIGVAPLSTIAGASLANVSNDLAYLGRALYPDPYFEGSIYEFSIWDNALSEAEVATRFTDGCIDNCGSRYLEINRISGEAQLINSLSDESIISYSLSSAAGSLNPAGWTSIADTGDANSGGSIDADDIWTVTSATGNNLAEEEPIGGGGPDDGAPLGGGFSLGNVWSKSRFEDVTLSLTILNPDFTERVENLSVQFVGNGGEAFSRSDLDVDGDIDADDYSALLSFHLNPLPGTTAFETAPFGDIDGDLDNDFDDFRLFKNDFIAANGAAAFAALSAVPEPSAALLALVAVASQAARRRE